MQARNPKPYKPFGSTLCDLGVSTDLGSLLKPGYVGGTMGLLRGYNVLPNSRVPQPKSYLEVTRWVNWKVASQAAI